MHTVTCCPSFCRWATRLRKGPDIELIILCLLPARPYGAFPPNSYVHVMETFEGPLEINENSMNTLFASQIPLNFLAHTFLTRHVTRVKSPYVTEKPSQEYREIGSGV